MTAFPQRQWRFMPHELDVMAHRSKKSFVEERRRLSLQWIVTPYRGYVVMRGEDDAKRNVATLEEIICDGQTGAECLDAKAGTIEPALFSQRPNPAHPPGYILLAPDTAAVIAASVDSRRLTVSSMRDTLSAVIALERILSIRNTNRAARGSAGTGTPRARSQGVRDRSTSVSHRPKRRMA